MTKLLNYFSVFSCVACAQKAPWFKHLCPDCEFNLPVISSSQNDGILTCCTACLLPLNLTLNFEQSVSPDLYCSECITQPKFFDVVRAPFFYQEPVAGLIKHFKFHKNLGLGKLITSYLIDLIIPDLIIPVPLHPKKLKQRGFNQSILISQWMSKKLKIPVNYKILKRCKLTKTQLGLSRKERLKNLKGAFFLDLNLKNNKFKNIKHIALVDDVMTTGATVNEISKILKQAGVEKIEVWCLARAVPEF